MTLKTGLQSKATFFRAIIIVLALVLTGVYASASDNNNHTNLSDKDYAEYVLKLKQVGLYENKDGTIGGVFNMVNGTTIRITGLDKDAGLIGAVRQSDGSYLLKRFSYKEMLKFIERRGG